MISDIRPEHYAQTLKINAEFVHWLSPLDEARLQWLLERAVYAKQIDEAQAILIGYAHDVDYPDHKNITWLKQRIKNFFYIDRIIIDGAAQGQGCGRQLYNDIENYARSAGHDWLACEVNTKPDNPGSHAFHLKLGFEVLGDQDYPQYDAALRYYAKKL